MPPSAQEQAEQVARYAEILAAQKAALAEQATRMSDSLIAGVISASLSVVAAAMALLAIGRGAASLTYITVVTVVTGVAIASAALSTILGFLVYRRSDARRRRDAERLASLTPNNASAPIREPESKTQG